MIRTEYNRSIPYVTKDGSTIRELIHPSETGSVAAMSLAEAVVPPGKETHLHRHLSFQEIYYLLEGEGLMTLGEETFTVKQGDAILIPTGEAHKIRNTGLEPLRFLCCCTPPYSHEETELLEST